MSDVPNPRAAERAGNARSTVLAAVKGALCCIRAVWRASYERLAPPSATPQGQYGSRRVCRLQRIIIGRTVDGASSRSKEAAGGQGNRRTDPPSLGRISRAARGGVRGVERRRRGAGFQ